MAAFDDVAQFRQEDGGRHVEVAPAASFIHIALCQFFTSLILRVLPHAKILALLFCVIFYEAIYIISNEKSLIFLDLSVYLGAYDKGGFISEGITMGF